MATRRTGNERKTRKVLVTGAGGCVGSSVIRKLLARGDRVVATDRPGFTFPDGPQRGLKLVPGDLTDPTLAKKLVRGVDGVIHPAALVDVAAKMDVLKPINVDAVAYLYDAAAAAGVKDFVHFSTGSIYAPQQRPVNEDDPLLIQNDYGLSKVMSEDLLREREGKGPFVSILRPSLIFGPMGRVLINLFAALPPLVRELSPVAPRLSGGPACNYVHADDVANAAIFLLDNHRLGGRAPHGRTYNIANSDPVSAGTMISETFEAFGMRLVGPTIPFPIGIIRAARPLIDRDVVFRALNAGVVYLWDYMRRRHDLSEQFNPVIPREMLDFISEDMVFSIDRLLDAGFVLDYPTFSAPWRETIAWFRANRWIPAEEGDSRAA